MIPLIAVLRIERQRRPAVRLWLPLFLLWLLLLPVLLILSPLFLIACAVMWLSPVRVLSVFGGIFAGFKGTQIEVAHSQTAYMINFK